MGEYADMFIDYCLGGWDQYEDQYDWDNYSHIDVKKMKKIQMYNSVNMDEMIQAWNKEWKEDCQDLIDKDRIKIRTRRRRLLSE